MTRSLCEITCIDRAGNVIQNARVFLYLTGTTTPVTDAFPSKVGGVAQSQFISDADGKVRPWFDEPKSIKTLTTDNGHTAFYPGAPALPLTFTDEPNDPVFVYENSDDEEADDDAFQAHIVAVADAHVATAVSYNNATSGLAAVDIQQAIDELALNPGNHVRYATHATMVADGAQPDNTIALVENTNRSYWWRVDSAAWQPMQDLGWINVLDYGAHWTLADNAPPFNLAVLAAQNTSVNFRNILVPAPPGLNARYLFVGSINPNFGGFKFTAYNGGALYQYNMGEPMVGLQSTAGAPIISFDTPVYPAAGSGKTQFLGLEGLLLYNPGGTCIKGNWGQAINFRYCNFADFGSDPAIDFKNTFAVRIDDCGMENVFGGSTGVIRLTGAADGNPDIESCYLYWVRNCIFFGGPMIEYHVASTSTTTPATSFTLENCYGEDQGLANGAFFRTTRDGAAAVGISAITIKDCGSFDPTGSGQPTLIRNEHACSYVGLIIDNSVMIGGFQQIKTTSDRNFQGVHTRGVQVQIVDLAGTTLHPANFGQNSFYGGGARFFGAGGGPDIAAGLSILADNTGNGLQFADTYNGDTFIRMVVGYDGYVHWGRGNSDGTDTNLYSPAANQLKTDDKLLAALGLGVGNSAAATIPGTVVRKMQVFDAAGASLGFVPIYDTIT